MLPVTLSGCAAIRCSEYRGFEPLRMVGVAMFSLDVTKDHIQETIDAQLEALPVGGKPSDDDIASFVAERTRAAGSELPEELWAKWTLTYLAALRRGAAAVDTSAIEADALASASAGLAGYQTTDEDVRPSIYDAAYKVA